MNDSDVGLLALLALAAVCALVFLLDWRGYRRCRDVEHQGPKPADTDWAADFLASEQGETVNRWSELP